MAPINTISLGKLKTVPCFQTLISKIPKGPGHECYVSINKAINNLGRAMQLGQHRCLINSLNSTLGFDTLVGIVSISMNNTEIRSAFSVYFTTLEQAYHWPRDAVIETPSELHDHKLVIQVLHHLELREMLCNSMLVNISEKKQTFSCEQVTQSALTMAKWMIEEAKIAQRNGKTLDMVKQDRVNLLYRTCHGDWFDQGNYNDQNSHKEFGRLHDVIRTNGTQRRVQELFELSSGVSWLQKMPILLKNLPTSSNTICGAFIDLQIGITLAREELFSMMIDETIWGLTFAKFSKAVGVNNISSGGADCPMFKMLDALCGKVSDVSKCDKRDEDDEDDQSTLLQELNFRSRFFPPNIRALIDAVATAPSIRAYVSSSKASYGLKQAFKALQQLLFDLYEMHRKKAMRITLAIRAGQLFTSSGTEKTSNPELHIANTLTSAMRVRFGDDIEALKIDAYAQASPLLCNANGQVISSRILFIFSSPLVVGPGDTINISVQIEHEEWHTRTYSITHSNTYQSNTYQNNAYLNNAYQKSSIPPCQAVSSVEVCVRNKGKVSSFLCSQQVGFPVRVAIKSASHFRINGNSGPEDETFFVAQGGAVGVFLGWFIQQDHLIGKYQLIVGARDYNMLPYASQLSELANKFSPSLRIVVGLSQESNRDKSPLSANIKVYNKRVTGYLRMCSLNKVKTTYVCGSATFGIDVANCITNIQDSQGYSSPGLRLLPIITSRLPSIRLHVAGGLNGCFDVSKLRSISKAELSLHNSPRDIWIALGDYVFDITIVSSFHPGGEKLLMYRAGRQAEEVFKNVHDGSYEIDSLLDRMIIGRLVSSKEEFHKWENYLDNLVKIQNDLTNYSRFEQIPTGSIDQINQAPPADVIRKSLDGFIKSWTSLLLEVSICDAELCSLQSTQEKVSIYLDKLQSRIYTEAFDDVECCAVSLRRIFDIHIIAISKIHTVIDDIKQRVFESFEAEQVPELLLFQEGTMRIVMAIWEMIEN
jgi:cytochrome b involved in lipid metabolism